MQGSDLADDTEPTPRALFQTLIQHDADIKNLRGDMADLKGSVRSLSESMATGFRDLGSKFATMNAQAAARPDFNIHQAIQTVLAGAILFSMIVGGIIWVTTQQFAGVVAKQESTNENVQKAIEDLGSRVGWAAVTKRGS